MFGGQGVLFDELMFALEAGGELYLKADETSVGAFRDAGSRQFVYTKDGRPTPMSYWRLPDAALDIRTRPPAGVASPSMRRAARPRRGGRSRGLKAPARAAALRYSITSSARARIAVGTARRSRRAVLIFTTSSIRTGCTTGRSLGFAPLSTLSTKLAARRNRSGSDSP